jgi:hypothetical protein
MLCHKGLVLQEIHCRGFFGCGSNRPRSLESRAANFPPWPSNRLSDAHADVHVHSPCSLMSTRARERLSPSKNAQAVLAFFSPEGGELHRGHGVERVDHRARGGQHDFMNAEFHSGIRPGREIGRPRGRHACEQAGKCSAMRPGPFLAGCTIGWFMFGFSPRIHQSPERVPSRLYRCRCYPAW